MKRKVVGVIAFAAAMMFSTAAMAQGGGVETDTGGDSGGISGHPSVDNMMVVAPHVGGTLPAFSDLGPWGIFGLELGFMPPMKNKPLEIAVVGRYTQPGASSDGAKMDPRLGDGDGEYTWELTQQMVMIDLVGLYRFRISESLAPYALAGPRANLMKTTMTAKRENGAKFGEVQETNTEYGFVVGGGVDYALGPGTAFGELKFGWTNLQERLTGDANTGSFVLDLGYRFYPF